MVYIDSNRSHFHYGNVKFLVVILLLLRIQDLAARPITVSEINFDRSEFVEFYNHTSEVVDLTGYTVIGGIDAFLTGSVQPNQYALIVGNIIGFRQRYGNAPVILGEFERRLDNQGEGIALRDPAGEVVIRINYQIRQDNNDKSHNWPPNSRSKEHPFELIYPDQPILNQDEGSNWRLAYQKDGSPGQGSDLDQDGLDDLWEQTFLNTLDWSSSDDPDSDGLDNATEQQLETHPVNSDTDNDGLTDLQETGTGVFVSLQNTGTDPRRIDTDSDGLGDGSEIPIDTPEGAFATDPHHPDSDRDTYEDGAEVRYLGNPLDAAIAPQKPSITSFEVSSLQYSAGEVVTLSWNIIGSDSRSLSPLPEHLTRIYSQNSSINFQPLTKTEILPQSQIWRYDRSNEDYGDQWINPVFDDSEWPTTATPFSFNPYQGPQPTPYFRTSIQIPDLFPGNRLAWQWLFRGGSAIYIDGQLLKTHDNQAPPDRSDFPFLSIPPDYSDTAFPFKALPPGSHTIAAANYPPFALDRSIFGLTLTQQDPVTGTFSYTLQATNPYGTDEKTVEFTILDDLPPLETFSQWAAQNLPDVIVADPKADPDHDGRDNLTEFLTASNPLTADSHPLVIEPGSLYFEVKFFRHRNPANASLYLEQSFDLINWTPVSSIFDPESGDGPDAVEIIDSTRERLTYRYRIHQHATPKYFRLHSSLAE